MKTCRMCKKKLEHCNFYKNCGSKDGYIGICKVCATVLVAGKVQSKR